MVLEKEIDEIQTEVCTDELKEIYESVFPTIAKFVHSRNGSFEDAKDILHDAFVVYLEKDSSKKSSIRISKEAYIVGIAKHLWFQKFKRDSKQIFLTDFEMDIVIPNDFYPSVNESHLLRYLELTGKKCLDLLRTFYYDDLNMSELAKKLGYRNGHSASVQKYKCLDKIRNVVKTKSLSYEDFTD